MKHDWFALLIRHVFRLESLHWRKQCSINAFQREFLRRAHVNQNDFIGGKCLLNFFSTPIFQDAVLCGFRFHSSSLSRSLLSEI